MRGVSQSVNFLCNKKWKVINKSFEKVLEKGNVGQIGGRLLKMWILSNNQSLLSWMCQNIWVIIFPLQLDVHFEQQKFEPLSHSIESWLAYRNPW